MHAEEWIMFIPQSVSYGRVLSVKPIDFVRKEQLIHFAIKSSLHAPCSRGSTENGHLGGRNFKSQYYTKMT